MHIKENRHKHLTVSAWFTSERDRIRTCDRLLRRQMLYPAELRTLVFLVIFSPVTVPIWIGKLYPAELRTLNNLN